MAVIAFALVTGALALILPIAFLFLESKPVSTIMAPELIRRTNAMRGLSESDRRAAIDASPNVIGRGRFLARWDEVERSRQPVGTMERWERRVAGELPADCELPGEMLQD